MTADRAALRAALEIVNNVKANPAQHFDTKNVTVRNMAAIIAAEYAQAHHDFITVPGVGNVGPTEYLALVCAAEVALAALNWLRQNPWMGYGDVVNKFGDRVGDDLAEALDSHLAQATELDPETNVDAGHPAK